MFVKGLIYVSIVFNKNTKINIQSIFYLVYFISYKLYIDIHKKGICCDTPTKYQTHA